MSVNFRIMNKRAWKETCLRRKPSLAAPQELLINPGQRDKTQANNNNPTTINKYSSLDQRAAKYNLHNPALKGN